MNKKNQMIKYLLKEGDEYELEVENLKIEIKYEKNNKTLEECLFNVLKEKMERR